MQRNLLLFVFLSTFFFDLSSQCEDGRYRDLIFQNFSISSDIQYGNNLDYLGASQDLYLDIYEPTDDLETSRPLVIVCHGGSFVSGSKIGQDVVPLCQDLAKMGYVVASIEYRLGISIFGNITENAKTAVLRGTHDSRAAIRYFRKDVTENDNSYRIDSEKIFIAGVSAGGFNALNVAYLDQESEIPPDIDQNEPGLGGGLEGESGNSGYSSEVAGVINVAGAIHDLDIMNNNTTPVCSFHGTEDSVVPFGSDILTLLGIAELDTIHGSGSIHQQANLLDISNCLVVQQMEGHVPHVANALHYDTLRSISSNFLSHLVCPAIELDCDYREIEIVSGLDEIVLKEAS